MHARNVASQSKRKEEKCNVKYLRRMRGLRNQNRELLENLCQPNILETQVIFCISVYRISQKFISYWKYKWQKLK